jgi:hypothetical protein
MTPRLILSLALLAPLAACGDDPDPIETGQYTVTWNISPNLAASTCEAEHIASVDVTTTDTATSDTHTWRLPCAAGTMTTEKLVLGNHAITVAAIGTLDEAAGSVSLTAALTMADQIITPPVAAIDTLPLETSFAPNWFVKRQGQDTTCDGVGSTGVKIYTRSAGEQDEFTDIYACNEPNAVIDLPLGSLVTRAELLGAGDAVIATAPEETLPPTRGLFEHTFTLNVP